MVVPRSYVQTFYPPDHPRVPKQFTNTVQQPDFDQHMSIPSAFSATAHTQTFAQLGSQQGSTNPWQPNQNIHYTQIFGQTTTQPAQPPHMDTAIQVVEVHAFLNSIKQRKWISDATAGL